MGETPALATALGENGDLDVVGQPYDAFHQAAHQLFFCAAGGAKATAASVVSRRKVKVSCK